LNVPNRNPFSIDSDGAIYQSSWSLMVCPSDTNWLVRAENAAVRAWTSYGGNTATGGRWHTGAEYQKFGDFPKLSSTAWLADWGGETGVEQTYAYIYPTAPNSWVHFRHTERLNMLSLDNHVATNADNPLPDENADYILW